MGKVLSILIAVALMVCMSDAIAAPRGYVIGTIVKVVDGDTLKIKTGTTVTNYRLALVDTPETYNNVKAKKDIKLCKIPKAEMFALGKLAKDYVKTQYSPGDTIRFKVLGTGRYHRPIIWVNRLIYNLIALGYGKVVDFHNVERGRVEMGRILETTAKRNQKGIWVRLEQCW